MNLLGILITLSIIVALFFISDERLLPAKERALNQLEEVQHRGEQAGGAFAKKQASGLWAAKKADVNERAERAGLNEQETALLLSRVEKKIFDQAIISSDAIDVVIDEEIQAIIAARARSGPK